MADGADDERGRLREAARRVDGACADLRRPSRAEAIELWRAVSSGSWSLVDHFESDGRRYIVARRNAPGANGARALTAREREVAWQAAQGHANKLIGYELGISPSSVATHLRRASEKLGVETRAELIALVRKLFAGEG
jgi:DNA-binding CsgD family transcriptional regulator